MKKLTKALCRVHIEAIECYIFNNNNCLIDLLHVDFDNLVFLQFSRLRQTSDFFKLCYTLRNCAIMPINLNKKQNFKI